MPGVWSSVVGCRVGPPGAWAGVRGEDTMTTNHEAETGEVPQDPPAHWLHMLIGSAARGLAADCLRMLLEFEQEEMFASEVVVDDPALKEFSLTIRVEARRRKDDT